MDPLQAPLESGLSGIKLGTKKGGMCLTHQT